MELNFSLIGPHRMSIMSTPLSSLGSDISDMGEEGGRVERRDQVGVGSG